MKLALLGDMAFLDENVLATGWKRKFREAAEILSGYDCIIANLEAPLTGRKRTFVPKGMHLKSDDRVIPILQELRVTAVSLANNHTYDYGRKGLRETISALQNAGIAWFGVDGKAFYTGTDANKIAIHGFCCYSTNGAGYAKSAGGKGVAALTRENLREALDDDRRNGRLSILSLHWGDEYSFWPNERQVAQVTELVKEYQLLIHGHHAHVVQGIQSICGSVVAYNLGNFYFDECVSPVVNGLVIRQGEANRQTFILETEISENRITNYRAIGLYNGEQGIERRDITPFLDQIGAHISVCGEESYKSRARETVLAAKQANLGPRTLGALVRKMNYYSVGAKVASYANKRNYERAF